MKELSYFLLIFSSFFLISSSCKKNRDPLQRELNKLPPITQNGANTFGCIVNGKALTPKGYSGNKPNFYIIADPGYGGNLDVRMYNSANNIKESFSLSCFGIMDTGVYIFCNQAKIYPVYKNESTGCYFVSDSFNYAKGFLKINRYDMQNGIVAGEFECTLYDKTTTCDTIKITNGHFDYKL